MYVDAFYDREADIIRVVERVKGQRKFVDYKPRHVFYYEDPKGRYTTIFGNKVSKVETTNSKKFKKELAAHSDKKIFEADINPIFRCLADHYLGQPEPNLHVAFFDIEVDFDPQIGFSSPEDPQTPITAITLYLNWLEKLVTLVLPPPTISWDKAVEICSAFDDTIPFRTERELLEAFLDLIEDVDLLSGWNSTFFDIPYIVRRIELTMSKEDTKRLCLWDRFPRKNMIVRYKKEVLSYDLIGRVHLDYLDLYRNNTYQEQHSYRLDFIGEIEVGEKKVEYEGTLDDLYKKDFEKFIDYNRQDVMLLVKIDKKNKYIDLSNQLAHTNSVLLKTTMGSVALIEQAIINEAHSRGMVVPNRKEKWESNKHALVIEVEDNDDDEEKKSVAGAYVADPKEGLSDWVGSIDLNSLYPSIIRSLNLGPETLVGQVRLDLTKQLIYERYEAQTSKSMAECWNGLFGTLEYNEIMNRTDRELTLDLESGESIQLKAWEIYNFIFEQGQPYCITANGTIFRTDIEGVIPGLLTRWYSERKEMKKKAKTYGTMASGVEVKDNKLLEELRDALKS